MPRKKKITKKVESKAVSPKSRRRKKQVEDNSIYTEIDQIFKLINKVQTNRNPVNFIVREQDVPMVDNILRDLDLPHKRKKAKIEGKPCLEYTVSPGKEIPRADHLDDVEELPDEILEDGQVFF